MPGTGKAVLIIDPVFRASRLQFTLYMVEALVAEGIRAKVLCRRDYESELFGPLAKGKCFEMLAELDLPDGFWFGDLSRSCLEQVQRLTNEEKNKGDLAGLWFSGFEEWRKILEEQKESGNRLDWPQIPVGMVLYDARFLLRNHGNVGSVSRLDWLRKCGKRLIQQQQAKKPADKKLDLLQWVGRQVSLLHFGLLDERVYQKKWAKKTKGKNFCHFWLPDPCPKKGLLPERQNDDSGITILLVGLQTKRKGLPEVWDAVCDPRAEVDKCRFVLMGRLSEETEELRSDLEKSALFEFREGFFSEEELLSSFEEADYVLLPYDRSFAGSSGVLAHAAATETPVISTEHGLIGYRVQKEGLGVCYRYGEAKEFVRALQTLPERKTKSYKEWQGNLKRYAEVHSVRAHVDVLQKEIRKLYFGKGN